MKTKFVLFIVLLSALSAAVYSAAAEEIELVNVNTSRQQYPVPNFYPIGQYNNPYQPNNNYVPNQDQYNCQPYGNCGNCTNQQPCQGVDTTVNPYQVRIDPKDLEGFNDPKEEYYNWYNNCPYTVTDCSSYYYPYCNCTCPYENNPYPDRSGGNVRVDKGWNSDGTISLTWTIINRTYEDWGHKNVDIKCISGCHLLTNPCRMIWDLPYTVYRSGSLSHTVSIWQPMYNETMTFAIVAGSKTLYTFTVDPN